MCVRLQGKEKVILWLAAPLTVCIAGTTRPDPLALPFMRSIRIGLINRMWWLVWADRLCCASHAQDLSLVDDLAFHIMPCLVQTVGIPHFHMAMIPAIIRTVHFLKRCYP